MSGGHFNYAQYEINSIADEVEQIIHDNGSEDKDEYGDLMAYNFDPETIVEFKKGLAILQQAFVYAHRMDWLLSGDDGEDSFHKRLAHDLAKIKEDSNHG
jgi:hypothetical protein